MIIQVLPHQLGNYCLLPSHHHHSTTATTTTSTSTTSSWSIITTYHLDSTPTFKFILQTITCLHLIASIHGPICYLPLDPSWNPKAYHHRHPLTYSSFNITPLLHSFESIHSVHVSILFSKSTTTHQSNISVSNKSTFSLLLPSLLNNIVVGGQEYIVETNDFLFRIDSCTPNKPGRISATHTTITFSSHFSSTFHLNSSDLKLAEPNYVLNPPAGLESEFTNLHELIDGAFHQAHLYNNLNTRPPTGVLIHGPPGVGKTWIVTQVSRALSAHLHVISVDTIISPFPGQSQSNLRNAFLQAHKTAESGEPTILLIDELEVLAPNRKRVPGMASVVAQLLTLLDGIDHKRSGLALVVIGATNRPNAIDPAVRRLGRLDREICISPPNALVRKQVLNSLLATIPTDLEIKTDAWLSKFAEYLPGYVGADLLALVREASHGYITRKCEGIGNIVTCQDLCLAQTKVPPSLRRGYLVTLGHGSSWDDIGGLDDVKQHLIKAAIWPKQRVSQFKALGITVPKGILMYGPPGCSKTTLVRILAQQTKSTFYYISPADIYSAYVGEAERTLRELFVRACATQPSVLFIDEIDALVGGDRGGGDVKHRLLLSLLAEIDGVHSCTGVLVIGATNYPDRLDHALVRPGRLDRCVYVRPPTLLERVQIFQIVTRQMPLDPSVNLQSWAEMMPFASGADIASIAREVALACLKAGLTYITNQHFEEALLLWHPVITTEMMVYYDAMYKRFRT